MQTQNINSSYITRLSSRNQTVIPAKVRRVLGLKKGSQIAWRLLRIKNKPKVIADKKPTNWADYTRGLGKEIWKNIDVEAYIRSLRQEWER